MGENQAAVNAKNPSLETILDEEIFDKKETGFFKRTKQGIEKALTSYKWKYIITLPASGMVGGAVGFIASQTIQNTTFLLEKLGRHDSALAFAQKHSSDPLIFGVLGAAVAYLTIDYLAIKSVGKKIIKTGEIQERKKKVKNFVLRHRHLLSIPTAIAGLAALGIASYNNNLRPLPPNLTQILIEYPSKTLMAIAPFAVGFTAGVYFFYDQLGKFIGIKDKDSWKNMGLYLSYLVSKESALKRYEKESKKGNIRATQFLSRVKKDTDEKLELRKKVIELQKKDPAYYGQEYSWTKPFSIGSDYYSFKNKKDINILIDMAMKLYDANPEKAMLIFDKLAKTGNPELEYKVPITRNFFLNNRGVDRKPHWQEARGALEKAGKLRLIQGSEGWYSEFLDEFVNKHFIFKDYKEDKSNKFFMESAILKILKGSGISVENPLFYYNEGDSHRQVFIRDGEKNLREFLEGKSTSERQDYFEKLLPIMMDYQEKVFSALEKQGSGFIMNTEFRGEKRRIAIPVLELKESLNRRAFYGSKPGEQRLGNNEYLKALEDKLKENDQLNPYPIILTFNRGDTTSTNVTSTFCEIDPRPCIYHPLYDFAYVSGDPAFLSVKFDSKKEKVLELILKKEIYKGMESDFVKAFDSLYVKLALCNAGANFYLGKRELTMIILDDLIEFSARKPFANELQAYLSHSNAAS